ncbi:tetratricopeptide repeat protein [Ascidiimonas sp. W6]|uniref:tetratricopeptide repeat protein n=1 Tax=Ascidiimonas meishanensis TaxID=3128903 RepID=UPI0030EDA0DF
MNKLLLFIIFFSILITPTKTNSQADQKIDLETSKEKATYYLKRLQESYDDGAYVLHKKYSDSLLEVSKEYGLTKMHILALNNQAVYHNSRSERLEAIELYHEALKKCELIPEDFKSKIIVLVNMGNTYNSIGSYEKSIEYMERVLFLLDLHENSDNIRAAALTGLANNYAELEDFEKTIAYSQQVKAIGENIKSESIIASSSINLCNAYISLKKYKKALEVGEAALNLSIAKKPTKRRAWLLLNIGIANFHLNKLDKSLEYLQMCLNLAEEKNLLEIKMYAHEFLAKVYEQNQDFKASLREQKAYASARDIFYKDKKAASNTDLAKQIDLKSKKITESNEELEEATNLKNRIALFGGGIILFFGSLLYIYIRRKKKLALEKSKLQTQYLALQHDFKEYIDESSKSIPAKKNESSKSELKPYKNSSLTAKKRLELEKDILDFMKNEKPFLDPEMTQSDLAAKLNISSHHFSEVLHYNMEQNFYNFINSYRIMEAQKLIKNKDYEDAKIISIAFDAGFKSKTSFNRLFKNYTGMTPSEFRKKIDSNI